MRIVELFKIFLVSFGFGFLIGAISIVVSSVIIVRRDNSSQEKHGL